MKKDFSKTKVFLALFSLIITFFVWQQGLRESLDRPSVTFDISQKEKEIAALAIKAIPINLEKFIIPNNPVEEINIALSNIPFNQLSERNKLILMVSSELNEREITKSLMKDFENKTYKSLVNVLEIKSRDQYYKYNGDQFLTFKEDKFLYHLLSKKFNFDESSLITKSFSQKMFLKILVIRLIPILTILAGTILVLKTLWNAISLKKIEWKELKPLDLDLIDMVLLIAGGFVVLGEVISPLFSISLVELFSHNLSIEISQSLKIFFGYFFMAIPALLIVFYQIKNKYNEFIFKKDYFQLNAIPKKDSIIQGFKGWLMIFPFVLLVSLIMNSFVDYQNGSNPLLEIVLNNKNYFSFMLLFLTTTLLAPLFEEIIFRGVLLPVLSRDFGVTLGIFVSAFIFALAHLSISEMPPLLTLGIGLGITRVISGSLLSSIVMHSLWNGLTFLNLLLLRT